MVLTSFDTSIFQSYSNPRHCSHCHSFHVRHSGHLSFLYSGTIDIVLGGSLLCRSFAVDASDGSRHILMGFRQLPNRTDRCAVDSSVRHHDSSHTDN
ncbi:hypothetical protein COOONC_18735 [Cooperia oncophora]